MRLKHEAVGAFVFVVLDHIKRAGALVFVVLDHIEGTVEARRLDAGGSIPARLKHARCQGHRPGERAGHTGRPRIRATRPLYKADMSCS